MNPQPTAGVCHPAEQDRYADFQADLERRGRARKTIDSYRSDHTGFVEWYATRGEPFDAPRLRAADVEGFREQLVRDGMRPATVNRKLVFLKRYAAWAAARGDLEPDAVGAIRAVKPVPQAPRTPRGLSDIELRRFLRAVDRRARPRDQAIVYTLLETGMRVSELVALEVDQITVGGRRAMVLVDDDRDYGGRSRRLALGPDARRTLRAYLAERGGRPGPLFQGERGPLTANAIQRIMRKYCAFAKVKASPSTLRHTFARHFLADDGDLVELADLLGHESLETTRLYLGGEQGAMPEPGDGPMRPRAVVGGG